MPQFDPSAVLRSPATLPRHGQIPSDPASFDVREIGLLLDDQSVRRRVLIAWDQDVDESGPIAEWWVYARREGAVEFDRVAMTEHPSVIPCCDLAVGVGYEFCVVSLSLDGRAHRPPDEVTNRRTVRLYGQEPLPPAPTGLSVLQIDERVIVQWNAVEYAAPVQYEVRVGGPSFSGALVTAVTRNTTVEISTSIPGGSVTPGARFTVYVVAVTMTGLIGPPAVLADFELPPAPDLLLVKHADEALWAGSKTGCLVDGAGDLAVTPGATSAIYVSAVIDAGVLGEYEIAALAQASIENEGLTWGMAWITWDSAEAARRTWEGGTAEWFPAGELERPQPPTWDELTGTWNDYAWLTWDSFGEERSRDDPSDLTWDEADFTWDSVFAESWSWDGPISSVGTAWALEIAFSDDGVTYSAFAAYKPQTRTFRYVQFRIVITQPVAALAVTIQGVDLFVVQRRAKGVRWVEETPVGAINGVNDTFVIDNAPAGASLLLIQNGTIRRETTDYTISGSTITTTTPPLGGDWLLARYQH